MRILLATVLVSAPESCPRRNLVVPALFDNYKASRKSTDTHHSMITDIK